jgi:hypothetical protein
MGRTNSWRLAVATALALAWTGGACATEYQVSYSGAQFGNSAVGFAYIDIADSVFTPGGRNVLLPDDAFQIQYVAISGASIGNGYFLGSLYSSYTIKTPSVLTPGTELIGQSLSNGLTYGSFGTGYTAGQTGDFSLFANQSNGATIAPTAEQRFVIGTSGGSGDKLAITSIAPYTPPPMPRYEVDWSGAPFGNGATATAIIDIASSVITTPIIGVSNYLLPSPVFRIESVTVSGAAAGNGTFGAGDFASYNFRTPSALDPTKDLVGQLLSTGFTFGSALGSSSSAGDFNLFNSYTTDAPGPGGARYVLAANGGNGDRMQLESIHLLPALSAVPEPGSWAMVLFGFALSGTSLRHRRRYATA